MNHGADPRLLLKAGPRRHPRLVAQRLAGDSSDWARAADALPPIAPFSPNRYHSVAWMLDWDHRLPSRSVVLRLYAFYSEERARSAAAALDERMAEIAAEDLYPEFDVPDFSGLPADECYETELQPGELPRRLRLVSDWRRVIDPDVGHAAVEVVRRSSSFQKLRAELKTRVLALGDLEAAEWCPPCESGQAHWGVEVWYLISFNGMTGEGRAYLVDVEDASIVSERDFQFRTG